ncbi:MAG: HAD-IB family hydrolase [Burkholderiales bacterium]|nr:HAD-IB family hydrolase [Burkholderiales bacterium]
MNLALFDLDYTLLTGDSDHAWGEFLVEEGVVDGKEYARKNDFYWQQYKAGTLDIRQYLAFTLASISGKSDAELKPLHQRYMASKIEPMIGHKALTLLNNHAADLCAIVTATNAFITSPIAARFGVPHLIACNVEMVDGRYTGRPIGEPSFRDGKVMRVRQWLGAMGRQLPDFEHSYFYSDSHNDLALMEAVSDPVAVNPDDSLRSHAEKHGWPIISTR